MYLKWHSVSSPLRLTLKPLPACTHRFKLSGGQYFHIALKVPPRTVLFILYFNIIYLTNITMFLECLYDDTTAAID